MEMETALSENIWHVIWQIIFASLFITALSLVSPVQQPRMVTYFRTIMKCPVQHGVLTQFPLLEATGSLAFLSVLTKIGALIQVKLLPLGYYEPYPVISCVSYIFCDTFILSLSRYPLIHWWLTFQAIFQWQASVSTAAQIPGHQRAEERHQLWGATRGHEELPQVPMGELGLAGRRPPPILYSYCHRWVFERVLRPLWWPDTSPDLQFQREGPTFRWDPSFERGA